MNKLKQFFGKNVTMEILVGDEACMCKQYDDFIVLHTENSLVFTGNTEDQVTINKSAVNKCEILNDDSLNIITKTMKIIIWEN